jgi:type VI secretion system secreted protein VgrG
MANDQKRQSKLSIELGGEQIDLIQLKSSEALSQAFHISIDMLSSLVEIDLMPHLGKPATVTIYEDDVLLRHFHGIVTDGEFLEEIEGTGDVYRLTMRPKSYLHEQGRKFRIFQHMTTRNIIKMVLDGCGIANDFDKLKGGNRIRKYCVQYGESDFTFACRLMEEEGIYYFYAHSERNHILTLCDSPSAHSEGKASPLTFNASSHTVANVDSAVRFGTGELAFVQEWRERVETGGEAKVLLTDFDFTRTKKLESTATEHSQHPEDAIEIHDHPGRYYVEAEGSDLAKARLEGRRANRQSFSGSSKNGALACGTTFTLKHPHIKRYNANYMLTRCQHSISSENYRSSMGGGGGHVVNFEAIPADTVWKSVPTIPRPVVHGPETAIVTGPPDEKIHCDEYGRIKVQFHWDQAGDVHDKSSCWIRVSQTGGLGNIILPRVGHEVLVDFLDGDPDRPLVVGRVFNKDHMPIYPLPDNKTRALWRTESYKEKQPSGAAKKLDSGDPGANELRFEDKAGEEEVYLHAQRDMNTRIQNDETHDVGNDQSIDIGQNQTITVGDSIKINAGKTIEIEAGSKITLKVGGSTITMDGNSIEIKTVNLKTNASLQAEHVGGSGKVNLDPSGVKINGTLVLIN